MFYAIDVCLQYNNKCLVADKYIAVFVKLTFQVSDEALYIEHDTVQAYLKSNENKCIDYRGFVHFKQGVLLLFSSRLN